jgi:hypothetical protein
MSKDGHLDEQSEGIKPKRAIFLNCMDEVYTRSDLYMYAHHSCTR